MALIERDLFMASLQKHFEKVAGGEGHCILLSGEAGIGKTALVRAFCKQQADECSIYQGACDDLFTPRPLAPLYDVLWQVNKLRWPTPPGEERAVLFTSFFQELRTKQGKLLLVFEDIHWADEGTLDFIKFFVRRIEQLPCLFILTYRDNEIHSSHPLRSVLGQLPPDSFTKLTLTPLSKQAVMEMAAQKGYSGEDVYSISGGNPFYVNEILASYSPGVPDNIKDSILSVYERQAEGTKNAWQIWSVMPEGLEVDRVAIIKSSWDKAINRCFAINVIIVQNGKVVFKHELYRRTIEESLTPLQRIELNKMMLDLFLDSFEEKGEIERILHYAKNADEKKLVVKYAPEAAKKAALIGAHKEAAKLFLTAIDYFEGEDTTTLTELYKGYAYECYLSNEIKEAITFTEKIFNLKENAGIEKIGNCLCFLSHLWWLHGNRKNAETFAWQAIDLLKEQPASSTKAMTFSNMSHLKMLSDEPAECMLWGEKAIEMATELGNEEILSHALNNMGTVQLFNPSSEQKGIAMLEHSLDIALQYSYHEQAARAYASLGSSLVKIKKYASARKALEEGISYCEERHLIFWAAYILSWKARLELDTGNWTEACNIADDLLKNEDQPAVIKITAVCVLVKILMRQGKDIRALLLEAKTMSFERMEPQWVIPSMVALLEYEWLTGKTILEEDIIEQVSIVMQRAGMYSEKAEFAFWMKKAGRHFVPDKEKEEAYEISSEVKALKAAAFWEKWGCPYEQALLLFEGKDDDKRKAMAMIQDLGAIAVYERLKQEMRNMGIKNIPRGIRNSTRSNVAFLTSREMDILQLLKEELHNKEIAAHLYISAKTVDHHISSILFKLDAASRSKAVTEAVRMGILK